MLRDNLDVFDCLPDQLRSFNTEVKMAQHFLNTVRCVIKECHIDSFFVNDKYVTALLHFNDELDWTKGANYIGRVDRKSGDYLLDSEFIYSWILDFSDKDTVDQLPGKRAFFNKMYHMGMIRPHNHYSHATLRKMRLDKAATEYFRIPYSIVNIETLRHLPI